MTHAPNYKSQRELNNYIYRSSKNNTIGSTKWPYFPSKLSLAMVVVTHQYLAELHVDIRIEFQITPASIYIYEYNYGDR